MITYTPMMQQYLQVKSQYEDAFVFFRLGDFYEMFFTDATEASHILEITLTSREGGESGRIPMCGVPYHSAQGYIETLVGQGHKVAICEQTEDPRHVKGIVKREVVKVITPGTITEGKTIDAHSNHFIGSFDRISEKLCSFAYVDLATGEGTVEFIHGDENTLASSVESLGMKEVVVDEQLQLMLGDVTHSKGIVLSICDHELYQPHGRELFEDIPEKATGACKRLVTYLQQTQKSSLEHLQPFDFLAREAKLTIDANSMRNLELVQSIRTGGKEGTLFWLLDETNTAMGARKLKTWIRQPLADQIEIEKRLDTVTELMDAYFLRDDLKRALREVYDLERLAGRISMGSASARDLAQLRNSLRTVPQLKQLLAESEQPYLQQFSRGINSCEDQCEVLEGSIAESPPLSAKEGGVIKDGFHKQLDTYRDASKNGKLWLAELEQEERKKTGIKGLKIGYNRIFGYYIEITKSNLHLADLTRYERKQTLANAERYITPELKEKEELILSAESESLDLEYKLFAEVREQMKEGIEQIQQLASVLSELDVLLAFAEISEAQGYVKPKFTEDKALEIRNGRHPVVEKMMDHSLYVPNSCKLAADANMLLITGPNMSGKSTYMRQVALTVVMAQIGCYVPCESASLPITDQIFTRIGAADDLASGQSTFMMEMLESQQAIANATDRSLLLFDEIGRGTSTYDGMSLAQAMMEYIHDEIGANTLFSTHYHELTSLDEQLDRLTNVHVAAMEQEGKVVFLHKVMAGPADKSYGIHVAELAGLPQELLQRARELLVDFENQKKSETGNTPSSEQISFFDLQTEEKSIEHSSEEHEIIKRLNEIDLTNTTPLQGLQLLFDLKAKLT
ncbi:DNA mismatch repair protein MutS [Sporosarcina aquimarina]|uniref:DNA mismatch repair protein MutS n=1 Tax=Sporosarcina aquimarina TaxID=114975 RepID=A0ABU4FWR9_9BACL|nr:DNA mismatch repair protein MutS [Sporosarcina aquimarina]MDW0109154.1 DNA mismatch repair protein MutS [Sporosarcina aquimarina]